jgi:hypothetical protein
MNEVLVLLAAARRVYYQEQPISVKYAKNKRRTKYHPDAVVAFTDGASVLVDKKPCPPLVNFDNIVKLDDLRQSIQVREEPTLSL